MKILVAAFACDPRGTSENAVGWQAVVALAKDHELCVIGCSRDRDNVNVAIREGALPPTVRFVFQGEHQPFHPSPMRAKLQNWTEYLSWMRELLPIAEQLHQEVGFDLCQHITYSSWRVGSPLWKLPIPFIWGPIGGVASVPAGMLRTLSVGSILFESARGLGSWIGRWAPSFRNCVRRASVVVAANCETREFFERFRRGRPDSPILCPVYFSASRIERFASAGASKSTTGLLRIFGGGYLIGSKGVAVALKALALVKKQGVVFRYRYGGIGPEIPYLRNLIRRLGLENEVIFGEVLSGADYLKELGESHVFLLPSFRENVGITLLEAMLAGCVPIVADASAQAEKVDDSCGYRIPVTSPARMAGDIARTIQMINDGRHLIVERGRAACVRIASLYSETHYRQCAKEIYEEAIMRHTA